jgi:DGQHR domain-containing protein
LEIRRYLDGNEAVLPNTIVVAFDERVKFIPTDGAHGNLSEYGTLDVPEVTGDCDHPGFVVDGQQRLAAIASCRHEFFPVFVTAMIATSTEEQREQFVLVNRTKPLPQGLIFELLPEIAGVLPTMLARQQFAATVTTKLNLDTSSSLYKQIKTPTCPQGVIKDNSIRRLVLNSLSDGALYTMACDIRDDAQLLQAAVEMISTFWTAVRVAFNYASELPPNRSRLTHGVGIAALGYVMDHIFITRGKYDEWTPELVQEWLETLKPYCAWTEGSWHFASTSPRKWNELQNIDRDIRQLTNYFKRQLEEEKRRKAGQLMLV